eukprot:2886692-Rhodomonas_salina.2
MEGGAVAVSAGAGSTSSVWSYARATRSPVLTERRGTDRSCLHGTAELSSYTLRGTEPTRTVLPELSLSSCRMKENAAAQDGARTRCGAGTREQYQADPRGTTSLGICYARGANEVEENEAFNGAGITLRRSAMSGTDLASGAVSAYAMSGTDLASGAVSAYAMSGTDLG